MKKIIGTCINFGPTFGFLGVGVYTNGCYEDRVYFHYKNLDRSSLRNPKQKSSEIVPGDVCEFEYSEGYYINEGTQAVKVRLIHCAENASKAKSDKDSEEAGIKPPSSSDSITAESGQEAN